MQSNDNSEPQQPIAGTLFSSEAWYFKTFRPSSLTHGIITLDNASVTMKDDEGNQMFSVPYTKCKSVKYLSGRLKLKADGGNFVITLFDAGSKDGKASVRRDTITALSYQKTTDPYQELGTNLESSIRSHIT